MLIHRFVPDRLCKRKRRRQIPAFDLSFGQIFTKDRLAFSAEIEIRPRKRKKGRYRRRK